MHHTKKTPASQSLDPKLIPLGAVLFAALSAIVWQFLPSANHPHASFDLESVPPALVLQPELSLQIADFDHIFCQLWESKRQFIKYAFDVGSVTTKLVKASLSAANGADDDRAGSSVHFAIQQVEGRKGRPINPVAELPHVVQPFTSDATAFNFNKKDDNREIMFTLDLRSSPERGERNWTSSLAGVLINSHPFSYGCVVIVVLSSSNLPQVLTLKAIKVGLLLAAQSTEGLRIGYNSLAGGASVNHLHFQGWYFNATPDGQLPVESAPYSVLQRNASLGLTVSQSNGYPIRSLLFSASDNSWLDKFASAIHSCVEDLLHHNVPHNLVFAGGGRRVYLIPRKHASVTSWGQRVGFPEAAGQIVTVSEEAFAKLSNQADVFGLLGPLSLSSEEFTGLYQRCILNPLHSG